jgi:hypothetical protein
MILYGYICSDCRNVDEAFDDEAVPTCCGKEMSRRMSKGGASGSVFQLFRPYHNGQSMITSKAEEKRMLAGMARTHGGGTAEDFRVEPVNAYKRKVEIEELRHKVVKQYSARSPEIAKRFADRPVKELKTL